MTTVNMGETNPSKKHRLAGMLSSESVEWNTPRAVFDPLDGIYHFDLDPCSDGTNPRCERFFTAKQDGLKQVWKANAVWLNPPYARGVTGKWMKKAKESVAKGDCKIVVALIPVRTGSKWFQEWVLGKADKVMFLEGRVHFIKNGVETEGTAKPAAFDSVIVIYDGSRKLGDPIKVESCGFDGRGRLVQKGGRHIEIPKLAAHDPVQEVAQPIDLSNLTASSPYMLFTGDSAQVLKGIPSNSISCVLTSPPYTTASSVPRQNYDYNAHYDFDGVFKEAVRVMAPGAFLLLNEDAMVEHDGPNKGGRSLLPYLHAIKLVELGLVRFDKITWNKKQAVFPGGYRQSHCTESIEVFYKPPFDSSQITILRDRPNNFAGERVRTNHSTADGTRTIATVNMNYAPFGRRTDIWSYSVGFGKNKSYDKHYLSIHPAIMHQGLVADLLKSFVRPVQANGRTSVVLDVFGGAFTTANETIRQGMFAIGIETSPNYCALGKRRLEETLQEIC